MSAATKSATLLRFESLKGTIRKAHRAPGAVLSTNLKATGHFVVTSPTHRVESTDVVPCLPTHTTTARKERGASQQISRIGQLLELSRPEAARNLRAGRHGGYGYSRWFERLLAELGFELWIGDPAEIKAKRVQKQKYDLNDARLLRRLMLENNSSELPTTRPEPSRPP